MFVLGNCANFDQQVFSPPPPGCWDSESGASSGFLIDSELPNKSLHWRSHSTVCGSPEILEQFEVAYDTQIKPKYEATPLQVNNETTWDVLLFCTKLGHSHNQKPGPLLLNFIM